MLVAYKHDEEHILQPVDLDTADKGSWIHATDPTDAEVERLAAISEIPASEFRSALDPEERSHVEWEEDFIYVVINTPMLRKDDNNYDTLPLGIFVTPRFFITVTLEETDVISVFLENRFNTFRTYKKTRFLFQIMSRTATLFLRALQEINHRTETIETQVRESMKNKEFFQLLELQKSLTYFTSALKANGIVMEKLLRLRNSIQQRPILKMYEEDEDLLEDVIVENNQAIETVSMYSNILISMMDAFASIISNNLNRVMKFMAAMTILLSMPTVVFSLWGINVPVPWQGAPYGFAAVFGVSMVIMMATAYFLWRRDLF